MANFVYVDNSNVWIQGMYVAVVANGRAASITEAHDRHLFDPLWNLDFFQLYQFLAGPPHHPGRAVLYGSRPPCNGELWRMAEHAGFEVVLHDRNVANREKKVDTSIAVDMISDSFERIDAERDEVTLVSGDRDLVPVIERLRTRGFQVQVVFWEHASDVPADFRSS